MKSSKRKPKLRVQVRVATDETDEPTVKNALLVGRKLRRG
jgi:hypothetical protein